MITLKNQYMFSLAALSYFKIALLLQLIRKFITKGK